MDPGRGALSRGMSPERPDVADLSPPAAARPVTGNIPSRYSRPVTPAHPARFTHDLIEPPSVIGEPPGARARLYYIII